MGRYAHGPDETGHGNPAAANLLVSATGPEDGRLLRTRRMPLSEWAKEVSDTPRTDSFIEEWERDGGGSSERFFRFARALERELSQKNVLAERYVWARGELALSLDISEWQIDKMIDARRNR